MTRFRRFHPSGEKAGMDVGEPLKGYVQSLRPPQDGAREKATDHLHGDPPRKEEGISQGRSSAQGREKRSL